MLLEVGELLAVRYFKEEEELRILSPKCELLAFGGDLLVVALLAALLRDVLLDALLGLARLLDLLDHLDLLARLLLVPGRAPHRRGLLELLVHLLVLLRVLGLLLLGHLRLLGHLLLLGHLRLLARLHLTVLLRLDPLLAHLRRFGRHRGSFASGDRFGSAWGLLF
jgi:hypothetical protein